MRKVLVIARAELLALVRSKAFLISAIILPLGIVALQGVQVWLLGHADHEPQRFAIIDPSGTYYPSIADRAKAHAVVAAKVDEQTFAPERVDVGTRSLDDVRLELSDRVRDGKLFAFVEVPATFPDEPLHFYSANAANNKLSDWLTQQLREEHHVRLYHELQIAPAQVTRLEARIAVEPLGLYTRDVSGHVVAAKRHDVVRSVIVPVLPPVLLFFFIVMSAPQLMNLVLVEKMTRVSEVLLGAVTPFQLMLGKLLGAIGVSLLLGVLYAGGGLVVAHRMGFADAVPLSLVALFLGFLVIAMLMYGSICLAVGSACTDLKEAQNLMMPTLMPLMLPTMMLVPVLESPSSPLAVGLTLFPLSSPIVTLLRIGLPLPTPAWQIVVALGGTLVTSAFIVWAASRIFRVGLLSSGKAATPRELWHWIIRG